MPTVSLNKDVFEKLVGKRLPEERLKERISMMGTDLESIEGNEINVEVFPNRPDMLSEQGFARAFSSFIGVKSGLRKYGVKKSGFRVVVDKSVTMRPYTVCALVKNMDFTDERIRETMQLQEKLSTTHGRERKKSEYGVYPSVKIKFPVNYIAKDPKTVTFTPLGMKTPIRADKVEQLHHTGRAFRHIAEGWKKYPFFIDSEGNVLSMLPYTNSNDTGKVDESTRDVFIECTGTNFENVNAALNILVTAFADMGGEIYSIDIVYPNKRITTPDLRPKRMKIDIDYCNRWLGLELKGTEVKGLLERMGYGYEKNMVLIPAYRADIMHQVDIFEDIAIAYGYENFEPEIPNISTIGEEDPFGIFKRKVAEIMTGLGFLETSTYHLTNNEDANEKMLTDLDCVELLNPSNLEYDRLRACMTPSLIKVLGENTRNDYPQKVFEMGTVFKKDPKTETGVGEFERIACASCHKTADYTEIRQYLDYLLSSLGIKYRVVKTDHPSFIPGRVGRLSAKGRDIAYLGEMHPEVLSNFGIEQPACAFELNLTELFSLIRKGLPPGKPAKKS